MFRRVPTVFYCEVLTSHYSAARMSPLPGPSAMNRRSSSPTFLPASAFFGACLAVVGCGGDGGSPTAPDPDTSPQDSLDEVLDDTAADDSGGDADADSDPDAPSDAADGVDDADTFDADTTMDVADEGDTFDDADVQDAEDAPDAQDAQDALDGDVGADGDDADEPEPFPPANHTEVTFTIDDTTNRTYTAEDGLAWKGSFSYDARRRVVTFDGAWGGPYPLVWDDGPWDAGGHEPRGSVAGDHIWGVSVWVPVGEAAQEFEYGAVRGSIDGSDGQWIWSGANGRFTVPADFPTTVNAAGLRISAIGTVDLRFTIDVSDAGARLAPEYQGVAYDRVAILSSIWGWSTVEMRDDGEGADAVAADGIYSLALSEVVGPHDGLAFVGDAVEFVFVLNASEYKPGGVPGVDGVLVSSDAWTPGTFSTESITRSAASNTQIIVGRFDGL
jgi:hypothetical protein